jgi:hypothetical protein
MAENEKDIELEDGVDEAEGQPQVKADDEGGVTVQLPEKKSRKERRAERGRDRYEELASRVERAEAEARRSREEAEEVRRQAYRERQEVFRQPPAAPVKDNWKSQLDDIRREQESIQVAFRTGAITEQAEVERLKTRFYDLDERREELRYEKLKTELSQQIPQRREGEDEERILRSEFPEVVGHQQAVRFAIGLYNQMVAEGKPATLATSKEAMRKAGERFGLYQASAPPVPPSQQQKYGSVPAQAGARTSSTEIRLTREQQRIARAAYPQLEDNEAFAKWATMYEKSQRESEATD